ncbi:sensor histidine kinase [Thermopolyspora sp. NPDC052614]|uniref:sensor histidine kinase n=1 Tax=Thermopolyspora sp. NPDC052614 TaxID=3155682 RepID=UPI003430DA8C
MDHVTVPSPTPASDSFTHVAAPFGSDREYLALVLPRVRAALTAGENVLVITGQERLALLREGLGRDAGAIDATPADRWYDHPARALNAVLDYAKERRDRRVLLIGDQRWQDRTTRETREWIRYESIANRVLATVHGTGLCLYDRRTTPPEVMAAMYRTHPYSLTPHPATASDPPRRNNGYVPPESMLLEGDDKPFDDPPVWSEAIAFALPTLKRLRDFVATRARRAGMPGERVSALILCVAEIAANAVEHGGGRGVASIWEDDDEIICEICDPGGTLQDSHPGYLPPPEGSPRGYGLWLTRQTCDLMEIRATQGVTKVRLHMKLP